MKMSLYKKIFLVMFVLLCPSTFSIYAMIGSDADKFLKDTIGDGLLRAEAQALGLSYDGGSHKQCMTHESFAVLCYEHGFVYQTSFCSIDHLKDLLRNKSIADVRSGLDKTDSEQFSESFGTAFAGTKQNVRGALEYVRDALVRRLQEYRVVDNPMVICQGNLRPKFSWNPLLIREIDGMVKGAPERPKQEVLTTLAPAAQGNVGQWSCTACTFLNPPQSNACEICETRRHDAGRGAMLLQASDPRQAAAAAYMQPPIPPLMLDAPLASAMPFAQQHFVDAVGEVQNSSVRALYNLGKLVQAQVLKDPQTQECVEYPAFYDWVKSCWEPGALESLNAEGVCAVIEKCNSTLQHRDLFLDHVVVVPYVDIFEPSYNDAIEAAKSIDRAVLEERLLTAKANFNGDNPQGNHYPACCLVNVESYDACTQHGKMSHWVAVAFFRDEEKPLGVSCHVCDSLNIDQTELPIYHKLRERLYSQRQDDREDKAGSESGRESVCTVAVRNTPRAEGGGDDDEEYYEPSDDDAWQEERQRQELLLQQLEAQLAQYLGCSLEWSELYEASLQKAKGDLLLEASSSLVDAHAAIVEARHCVELEEALCREIAALSLQPGEARLHRVNGVLRRKAADEHDKIAAYVEAEYEAMFANHKVADPVMEKNLRAWWCDERIKRFKRDGLPKKSPRLSKENLQAAVVTKKESTPKKEAAATAEPFVMPAWNLAEIMGVANHEDAVALDDVGKKAIEYLDYARNAAFGVFGSDPLCSHLGFAILCYCHGFLYHGIDGRMQERLQQKIEGRNLKEMRSLVLYESEAVLHVSLESLETRVLEMLAVAASYAKQSEALEEKASRLNHLFSYDPTILRKAVKAQKRTEFLEKHRKEQAADRWFEETFGKKEQSPKKRRLTFDPALDPELDKGKRERQVFLARNAAASAGCDDGAAVDDVEFDNQDLVGFVRDRLMGVRARALGENGGDPLCTEIDFAILCYCYGIKYSLSTDVTLETIQQKLIRGRSLDEMHYLVVGKIVEHDKRCSIEYLRALLLHDLFATELLMRWCIASDDVIEINEYFTFDPEMLHFTSENTDGLRVTQSQVMYQKAHDCPAFALFNAGLHAGTLDKRNVGNVAARYNAFYRQCHAALGRDPQDLHDDEMRQLSAALRGQLPQNILVVPYVDMFEVSSNETIQAAKNADLPSIETTIACAKDSWNAGQSLYCVVNTQDSAVSFFQDMGHQACVSHWICVIITKDEAAPRGFAVEVRDSLNQNWTGLGIYKHIIDRLQ